jgi:hypothetical protein
MKLDHFALLHRLYSIGDIDLTVLLISTIHNLSGSSAIAQMTATAYELMDRDNLQEIFDRILAMIAKLPKTFILLSILAPKLGNDAAFRLADTIIQQDVDAFESLVRLKYWYAFPILLMYNVPSRMLDALCVFFARVIVLAGDRGVLERSLDLMIRITVIRPECDPIPPILRFLHGLVGESHPTFLASMVKYCYTLFFLHMSIPSHNPAQLAAFQRSVFARRMSRIDDASGPIRQPSLPLPKFEALLDEILLDFQVHARVEMAADCGLPGEYLAQIALSLIPAVADDSIQNTSMRQIFALFVDRGALEPNAVIMCQQHLTQTLETARDNFGHELEVGLRRFRDGF